MAHPSKDRGDRFERDTIAVLERILEPLGLTVERTRAGYQRDGGDVHVLTPDGQVLATVQCKSWNQGEWRLPQWLGDLGVQRAQARARFGVLALKRPRVSDAAFGYALTDVETWAVMLAALVEREIVHREDRRIIAELRRELARVRSGRPSYAEPEIDPDVLPDEPGTVRGAQVYPQPYVPAGRPFGPPHEPRSCTGLS